MQGKKNQFLLKVGKKPTRFPMICASDDRLCTMFLYGSKLVLKYFAIVKK